MAIPRRLGLDSGCIVAGWGMDGQADALIRVEGCPPASGPWTGSGRILGGSVPVLRVSDKLTGALTGDAGWPKVSEGGVWIVAFRNGCAS